MDKLLGMLKTSESHAGLLIVALLGGVKLGIVEPEQAKSWIEMLALYAVMRLTGKSAKAVMPNKEDK